jgi:predicted nucleic acid-binding protein
VGRRTATRRTYRALILDSDGISKAARGDRATGVALAAARRVRIPVVVSAVTLAEVLRGHPRDAAVYLLLKGCRVEPVSTAVGRAAGELLGRTGRKDTVDAVVVATAATLPAPVLVLTSDPSDLGALTADLPGIDVEAI